MAQLKFYTDTHIAKAVADQLRSRGVDIVRCEEVGLKDALDNEHFEYATNEGRTIITGDLSDGFLDPYHAALESGTLCYGILFVAAHLRRRPETSVGPIVKFILDLHGAVLSGDVDPQNEVYNLIDWIT